MTDEPVTIFITGTAGAGKSSFSQSFGVWLNNNNYDSTIVNMDPGASDDESSSFDIDIREWIDIAQVMEKYKLGVNGAQIVAADLITLHINEIKEEIDKIKGAYTIIDTPGQIELFYLRESGQVVIDSLGNKRSVICFLYDPFISASPSIFMSLRTMALLMEFRFSIPMINILSKSDLISDKKNEKVREWMMNSNMLFEDMSIESPL
ncbi:MAG: ATP/GTP-binding protein, partial [Candidatus Thermoplasmatota archaeon]|nr:ATP/GTP-binding protein [Candidatus Thermoplasmatota archaeon]